MCYDAIHGNAFTIITVSSIIFAVIFAVFMRSLQYGAYSNMLKNIVSSYLGYIQIHQKGFWSEKTLDNSFTPQEIDHLTKISNVNYLSYRIEGFALVSKEDISKPVAVLGLDAEKEKSHIGLHKMVVGGQYFSNQSGGLLIAVGLRDIMKLKLRDSLVFLRLG